MKIPSFGSLNRTPISKTRPFGVIVDAGFSRDNGARTTQLVFVVDFNHRSFHTFKGFGIRVTRFLFSFSTTKGWGTDLGDRELERVVHFKMFV